MFNFQFVTVALHDVYGFVMFTFHVFKVLPSESTLFTHQLHLHYTFLLVLSARFPDLQSSSLNSLPFNLPHHISFIFRRCKLYHLRFYFPVFWRHHRFELMYLAYWWPCLHPAYFLNPYGNREEYSNTQL